MAYVPPPHGTPGSPKRSLVKLIVVGAVALILLPLIAYGLFLGAILYDWRKYDYIPTKDASARCPRGARTLDDASEADESQDQNERHHDHGSECIALIHGEDLVRRPGTRQFAHAASPSRMSSRKARFQQCLSGRQAQSATPLLPPISICDATQYSLTS